MSALDRDGMGMEGGEDIRVSVSITGPVRHSIPRGFFLFFFSSWRSSVHTYEGWCIWI